MKRKYKMLICGAVLGSLLLTGCGQEKKSMQTESISQTTAVPETTEETSVDTEANPAVSAEGTEFEAITAEVAGWTFTVEDVKRNASLENMSVELGYTGVETSDYVKEASEGMEFVLIKLKIEKNKSTEMVRWEDFKLIDENGKEYIRLSDEFLVDLGMMRMTGSDLNFGSNEGWIAYEVDAAAEALRLHYAFAGESYTAELGSGR